MKPRSSAEKKTQDQPQSDKWNVGHSGGPPDHAHRVVLPISITSGKSVPVVLLMTLPVSLAGRWLTPANGQVVSGHNIYPHWLLDRPPQVR